MTSQYKSIVNAQCGHLLFLLTCGNTYACTLAEFLATVSTEMCLPLSTAMKLCRVLRITKMFRCLQHLTITFKFHVELRLMCLFHSSLCILQYSRYNSRRRRHNLCRTGTVLVQCHYQP